MKFTKVKDYEAMSQLAAELVIEAINKQPNLVVCFPTGGTPIRMYELLVEAYHQGRVDFSAVRVRSVDDYIGLPPDHEQSYYYYLNEALFSKVNVNPANIKMVSTCEPDMEKCCLEYAELLVNDGGIDLMIDGIGENGHIGFNEPAPYLCDRYHVERVSDWTIEVNGRFFNHPDEVPKYAVSVGVLDLLEAKQYLVLSSGVKKAKVWQRLLSESRIDPQFPASFLKLAPHVHCILDEESASLIDIGAR
jgi:glucosamine-6-phosphate deaminase